VDLLFQNSGPLLFEGGSSEPPLGTGLLGYHSTAMARMHEYLTRYTHPAAAIDVQCNQKLQLNVENNLKVMESLFKIVLLCGKQGIALRGHRDDKIDWFEQDEDDHNRGNFIESLFGFKLRWMKHLGNIYRMLPEMPNTPQKLSKMI